MKPQTICSIVVLMLGCLALLTVSPPVAHAILTTTTLSITGYNSPSPSNLVNAFIPLVLPLIFAEIFGFMLYILKRAGDFFVTLWDFGIALGSSFGTLVGQIPIAMTIITWVILALWWWSGGQGEGATASGDSELNLPRGF